MSSSTDVCCRRYIPANCLVDGEQNDSAEVLELLCSTVGTELAHCRRLALLQQAQTAWQMVRDLQQSPSPAAHRSRLRPHDHSQQGETTESMLPSSDPQDCLAKILSSHATMPSIAHAADAPCMPLQGTVVGDMLCLKCQHSFESQHTPFILVPLALPTAQVHLLCTHQPALCSDLDDNVQSRHSGTAHPRGIMLH